MLSKIFTLAGMAMVANAHIEMTNPVPYGRSSLNNGPLDAGGADFPCKQRPGVYEAEGASNVYAQGSTQQLSFIGTAVHGGGSCQVSVTTDRNPTRGSVWKVIKSIEGGCPAQGAPGNIGDDASAPVPFKYDFTIPNDLAAGEYTVAWTWFNKIGNREMYMNCAPMTVTGSGGSGDFMNSLPDMFVANIANGCTTTEGTDVKFPNPGNQVAQLNGATNVFGPPVGACATSVAVAQPPASPPQTTPGPSPPKPNPGGVFITKPNNQPAPTPAPAPAPAPAPVPAPNPGSGGVGALSGGCNPEGQWNCIGGNSFQRCGSGSWSAAQPLAGGMRCEPGQASDLRMIYKRTSRAIRRSQRVRA